MGTAAVKIKVMPESLEIDLEDLKNKLKQLILDNQGSEKGSEINIQEEPIAFGLKALIVGFAWQEEISTDELEKKIQNLEGVSSLDIIDFRRAFG